METEEKNIEVSSISKVENISEQNKKLMADFSIFALELIKTMVRAGIYSDNHPVTAEAVTKTFALFHEFQGVFGGVTFILYESPDMGHDINVEGITSKWVSLKKLLRGAVGEHFVGKFSDLFRQNKIASITLSSSLSEKEFGKFVNLFVSWRWSKDKAQESLDAFSNAMMEAGVFGITVVGLNELLGGNRNLPWQIRVAITRVKKDLSKIPMLKDASAQQVSRLKLTLLSEIARPIKYPVLILQLLTNVDLAAKEIPFVTLDDITDFLIKGLVSRHLLESASQLLLTIKEKKYQGVDTQEKLGSLLKKMVFELAGRDFDRARPFLETCFKDGIIKMADMPRSLQREIQVRRAIKGFMAKRKLMLNKLLSTKDPHEATKLLNVLMLAMPDLVEKSDAKSLNLIGLTLAKLYRTKPPPDFPGRRERIGDVLVGAAKGNMLGKLVALTCRTPKEKRKGLDLLLVLYGRDAVPPLINVLIETENMSARRAAVDLLLALGKDALDAVIGELRSHRHPWYTVRNLLHVLGELGGISEAAVANEFYDHPHPKVREQYILTIEKLMKSASESKVLPLLEDEDAFVRKQAIVTLARLNCTDMAMLNKMKSVLAGWAKAESKDFGCLIAVVRALSFYDPMILPDREEIEELLLNIVRKPTGLKAMIPTLMGVHEAPLEIKMLVIETLGYLGGTKSLDVLSHLQKSKNARLAERARDAIALLKKKLS